MSKNKNYMVIMVALVAMLLMILPVSAASVVVGEIVGPGATVFIGEEGLDISSAMGGYTTIGYWAAGATLIGTSPSVTISVSSPKSFSISASNFKNYIGNWYRVADNGTASNLAFRVADPSLSLLIENADTFDSIGGKTVVVGTPITFKIDTNIRLDTNRGDSAITEFAFIPSTKTSSPLTSDTAINAPTSVFIGESDGLVVTLNETSVTNVDSWLYSFGDGTSITTQNASHTYSAFNTYNVTLKTTNTSSGIFSMSNLILKPSYLINTTAKGYIDIIVKSESGATYSSLQTLTGPVSLQKQFIAASPYYWNNSGWATANMSGGQRTYQSGIYQVWAECNLNGMKENYKDSSGAYYTGKTVSSVSSVTLGSDTLSITSNKASVVRGKPFSVTVTGAPRTVYKLWIKGIYPAGTTPVISDYQEGVTKANSTFASISTDSSGVRVIGFTTSSNTKEQKYTIRVESTTGIGQVKSDEVAVNVVKGGMTLVAAGDQNYYIGEEIKLSGTNSESETTYLFIVGPNLDSSGAQLTSPRVSVNSHDSSTFTDVPVDDGSYTYTWATSGVDLDSGTYTIYGVSQLVDRSELQNASYATVSVVIKKPYVSARASQSTIAKGDKLFIEGDAQGNPSSGVAVWILGKNYAKRFTQSVESDSTYKYEIPGAETYSMASGQYFIVVQHPMQNDRFDIDITDDYVENIELGDGTRIFKLYGSGSLQGSDAAEALIQAISDPNVDDTYTKLTIIVSEPLIAITPISDRHIGDRFNITGKTNLAVDDEILMEVYSSSFKPTQKVQSGEFSGATGNIKVVKGEDGMNTFSFDIDASTFKVDEYIVVAQSIVQDATGTALFNVVEGASTNPVVTPVAPVVTAPPVIVTAIPTVPPTAPPTPIPTTIVPTTTQSPGFGAVFALAGLGVVGFMIVRRE